jgi:Flp pilus assembly protein TadG
VILSRFHPKKAFRSTAVLSRFGTDASGIAAVEFGLIAPVALVMLLGLIECGRALVMARRFNLVTAVASDIVARSQTMSDAELDGIAKAVEVIWRPYDAAALNFTVTQIRAAGTGATAKPVGQTYIDWGRQFVWTAGRFQGSSLPDNCTNKTIGTNIVAPGGSTILVESNFTFAPLFTRTPLTSSIMPASTWNWGSASTHVPRQLCVDYRGNNCLPRPGCEN